MNRRTCSLVIAAGACVASAAWSAERRAEPLPYHSPLQVAWAPGGRLLAVSDPTARAVALVDAERSRVVRTIPLGRQPVGVAWSADGEQVYAADVLDRSVTCVDAETATVRWTCRLPPGARPVDLAPLPRRGELAVADSSGGSVWSIDASGKILRRRRAGLQPHFVAVTGDETTAVVTNRTPVADAGDPRVAATVTIVDLSGGRPPSSILLPPNSTNVNGAAISPGGRWAYVAHNLARATLPTEQIEYGWISANALSVIDIPARRRYATILLDRFNRGAANPYGTAVSPEGSSLWITLGGAHQIARIDLDRLHGLLPAEVEQIARQARERESGRDDVYTARGSMDYSDSWRLGVEDPTSVELVVGDLPAEYGQGRYLGRILFRADLPGNGPRGVAVSPDGSQIAAAMYYSGDVVLVDAATREATDSIPIGRQPPADPARRGEMIFHDATYCFQQWLSCSTCHPDGRSDGLNWDLLNDGIGNPKNTRSLVWAARTPPAMSRGVRPDMEAAAAAGFQHLLFQAPKADELEAVRAYLRGLTPEPSPFLEDGRLSEEATAGRAVFEDPEVGCARCHSAPLYTDQRMHDVATALVSEKPGPFDTPALVELWRTAPYLHHGRAVTLRQLLTDWNPRDRHGKTSQLSREELDALIAYLRSL